MRGPVVSHVTETLIPMVRVPSMCVELLGPDHSRIRILFPFDPGSMILYTWPLEDAATATAPTTASEPASATTARTAVMLLHHVEMVDVDRFRRNVMSPRRWSSPTNAELADGTTTLVKLEMVTAHYRFLWPNARSELVLASSAEVLHDSDS